MRQEHWTVLHDRGLIAVTGKDARSFLQGLITNDIRKVVSRRSIYSAILTPQGKLIYDFFIVASDNDLLIDCNSTLKSDLIRRFNMYKLRADINIEDRSCDFLVLSSLQTQKSVEVSCRWLNGVIFTDPRCPKMGHRAVVPITGSEFIFGETSVPTNGNGIYESTRIRVGIPDCAIDCLPGEFFALECCLDEFGGISFEKGCFIGQEVTTRMKHRKLVRKKLVPISIDATVVPHGTPIFDENAKVGEIRSCRDGHGIAMLRLDHAHSETLLANNLPISVKNLSP